MDIYENIIIGNFLFMLGVQMGIRRDVGSSTEMTVNLLQQTPLDQHLGDVFFEGAKLFRIIEFKRTVAKADGKEAKKLERLLGQLPEHECVYVFSRRVHWYVESDFRDDPTDRSISAIPYLDFMDWANNPNVEPKAFLDFINDIADIALKGEPQAEGETQFQEMYLKALIDSEGTGFGSSGCMVLMLDENNRLSFTAIDKFADLKLDVKSLVRSRDDRQRKRGLSSHESGR